MRKLLFLLAAGIMFSCSTQKGIKIHGKRFIVEKIESTENSLPLKISSYYKKKDSIYITETYIPKKVKIDFGLKDQTLDEVEFVNENRYPTTGEMAINERYPTEVWNSEGLKEIEIFEKKYLCPYVSFAEEHEQGKLFFYLIPKEGSSIKGTPYGNMVIRNENNIYRPVNELRGF